MWTWVCHCDCPAYVAGRWLTDRPKKEEDAVRKVENHFFAIGNRALIRDNGVSRLWWLGKIAHDVSPDNPREFLTILLHRQDVRSALIERPSVSMNRRVLHGIFGVMREQWADGGKLFERQAFRSWMVALNRRGGVVLLTRFQSQSWNDYYGRSPRTHWLRTRQQAEIMVDNLSLRIDRGACLKFALET